MRFESILSRDESAGVLSEVLELATHRSIWARGVRHQGNTGFQFVAEVDLVAERWHAVTSTGQVAELHDGMISFSSGGPNPEIEGPVPREFSAVMPPHVRLLHPENFLMWGRYPESYYPILAQRLGKRSILLTFEHVDDPPSRATMVIDTVLGIARRFDSHGDVTFLLDIEIDRPFSARTDYEFVPITDSIHLNY